MSAKFALRSILVLCVIMLLSTLVVGSAVSAQEIVHGNSVLASQPEQSIQGDSPVPGGPGFISVSSFAFKPWDSTMKLAYYPGINAWLYNDGTNLGVCFAPVNLPHGATLTHVLFFYYDEVAPDNITFYLDRINMFDGSRTEVSAAISSGAAGLGYTDSEIYFPEINNQLYSYVLRAVIVPGSLELLSLISVRIDYSYPAYLPTVMK